MDWARAVERNREALVGLVAALFAMLGLQAGGTLGRIPRAVHRAVLRLLRPAESAARRLIVIAARGLVVKLPPARPMPAGRVIGRGRGLNPSFRLFDRRKRFAPGGPAAAARPIPRIRPFTRDPRMVPPWSVPRPAAEPAPPDEGIDSQALCRRLHALALALQDVPRQARRLLRLRARREKASTLGFASPLRPGRRPGYRRRPVHDVDFVLVECHGLARDAMADTS